jgi:tetratricopeptide (TPR) repeat protein
LTPPHKDHAMNHRDMNPAPTQGLMPEGRAMLNDPARTALREAAAALDLAERYKQPLKMCLALAQMARCYRGLQALDPAECYLQQALRWARTLGAVDQAVEILCLLAETRCALAELNPRSESRRNHAALERTRDCAFEIAGLASRVADPHWEITVLLRAGDVLDRCGDHDDAVELQSRAMRLMYGDWAEPGGDDGPGGMMNMLADHRA